MPATATLTEPGERLAPAARPDTPHEPLAPRRDSAEAVNFRFRWLILIGLILAAIMEVLDTTITNVALPQMAGNLGTTTQDIAWVSTGYILANVVVLPMTAFLTARFGRRNYLTASVVIFTVSSLLCGLSTSLGAMVVWRILQGAAGAALISTAQATLVQVFPPREQAIVQPLFMMGLVVAPTLGPVLGGYLTESVSWNWCFFINVPIGIIATFLVMVYLHDTEKANANIPVDWAGILLLTAGLGSLQYVLEEGETDDWFQSAAIVRLTVLSVISLLALIAWQISPRNRHPVVDFRVLRNPALSAGIALFIAVGFGLYGVSYLFPLMAQTSMGLNSLQTGLAMLPGGLATAVAIVFCAVITSQPGKGIDPRLLILIGSGLSIWAMWKLSNLSPQSGIPDSYWPMLLRGASIGFLIIPINQTAMASLNPSEAGQGASLLGLGRQLGGSFGTAVLATALSTGTRTNRAHLVTFLNNSHPAFVARESLFTQAMMGHGMSFVSAQKAALSLIDSAMMAQSLVISFNHTFIVLLVISLATTPAVLVMRRPKAGEGAGAAMH